MTLRWSRATLDGWGDELLDLDVFVQPGLTWHDGEVKAVALLLLEQVTTGSADERDFSTLVTALTRWLLASANVDPSSTPSAVELQEVLDDLAAKPPTPAGLRGFLRRHVRFQLKDPTGPTQGTVFPFLPGLRLAAGLDGTNLVTNTERVDALDGQAGHLAVTFGDGVDSDRSSGSILEHILVGYGRLLMSNGLQILIDQADRMERGDRSSATLAEVLVEQATIDRHAAIGAMASRFLLHGASVDTDRGQLGLHAFLGLQFPLDDTMVPGRTRRIVLSGATDRSLFHFDGASELEVPIPANRLRSRSFLVDAEADDVAAANPPPPGLRLAPTHQQRRLHFGLRSSSPVGASSSTERLFPLPSALTEHLHRSGAPASGPAGNDPLTIDLVTWPGGRPPADDDAPGLAQARFRWATRIDVRVRRVTSADGGESVADVVEVVGASEADKDLLQEIWPQPGGVTLRLLVVGSGDSPRVTLLGDPGTALLVRSDLSTDTGIDPDRFRATPDPVGPFLQLLWEGLDADTGGFYLSVPGAESILAGPVFAEAAEAVVTVLIEQERPGQPNRHHNCVVLADASDLGPDDLLLARSSRTLAVSSIPAGHIGFELTKAAPGNQPARKPPRLESELAALYHLLGWRLAGPSWLAGSLGPVVGPTKDDAGWRYDRLFPVFGDDGDPYRAIGAGSSSIAIEAWWNDLYGNRLDASARSELPIGYFDDIIGIHQWPSVAADYEIVTHRNSPAIRVRLDFDPSPYRDGAPTDRRTADQGRYRSIAQQLAKDDVEVRLATTLQPDRTMPLDKEAIERFVTEVRSFLERTVANPPVFEATIPLDVDVGAKPFVFPVSATVTIARDPDLVLSDPNGPTLPASVERADTVLGPRQDGDGQLLTFARHFQEAIVGTRLAVGAMAADIAGGSRKPVYAARLGTGGLRYDIDPDQEPMAYALPPLSTSVVSTTVPVFGGDGWPTTLEPEQPLPDGWTETRFDNVDLDALLRQLLVTVERVLDPGVLVPAARAEGTAAAIDQILATKARLARALSRFVRPVLADEERPSGTFDQAEAAEAVRQALLGDLVGGYDVETVVQHRVALTQPSELEADDRWPTGERPRVRGKVRVRGVRVGENTTRPPEELPGLDMTLSAGHLPLAPATGAAGGQATFTYLFDTKRPERFEDVQLDLEFVPTDLEVEVVDVPGVPSRQSSNFLSFVIPEPAAVSAGGAGNADGTEPWTLRQGMGAWPIPIPLRQIPAAPALIQQHVEADASSRERLADVRQWEYDAYYEHPFVSQDVIHGLVELNVVAADPVVRRSAAEASSAGLVEALVVADHLRPVLLAALDVLEQGNATDDRVERALAGFAELLAQVVTGLETWTITARSTDGTTGDLRLDIAEEAKEGSDDRDVTVEILRSPRREIRARLELPGHGPELTEDDGAMFEAPWEITFSPDGSERTTFGDSSIPDRRLRIDNLDVLRDQNAWASIWLTRNRELGGRRVDPVFVYRTPTVRFPNMVTPFLTNDEPWDIPAETGGSSARRRPLAQHLRALFRLLVPRSGPALPPYRARLSCRYAFTMAIGTGLNDDLVTAVPILLGMPDGPAGLDDAMADRLSDRILAWYRDEANRPTIDGASLRFAVDLFAGSDQGGLPTLRITDLRLDLVDIAELTEGTT